MPINQDGDQRSLPARIFFTDEGEVNRRNIFILILLLVILGNIDRVIK